MPYTGNGDAVSPTGAALGAFATPYIGTSKAITVSGIGVTGTGSGNYTVTQQTGLTCTVIPETVTVSGTASYNGTTSVPGTSLTVANANGDAVTLTNSGTVASRNVGTYALSQAVYATPTRVHTTSGNTGTGSTSTTFSLTIPAPANGNTLVAVVATHGTNTSQVSGIGETGATWTRAAQANTNGVTTEIWYAPNVLFAGASVTITQVALRSAAIVIEYSGLLTASALDQTAFAFGSGAPTTGTTPTTTQAAELWLGAIGLTNSVFNLTNTSAPLFTTVTNAQSGNSTAGNNARVYALEYIASPPEPRFPAAWSTRTGTMRARLRPSRRPRGSG